MEECYKSTMVPNEGKATIRNMEGLPWCDFQSGGLIALFISPYGREQFVNTVHYRHFSFLCAQALEVSVGWLCSDSS